MRNIRTILLGCCLFFPTVVFSQSYDYYKRDPKMDHFVDSLLSIMTLEDKIGQTVLYTSGWDVITGPVVDPDYQKYIKTGMVGAIFNAKKADYK